MAASSTNRRNRRAIVIGGSMSGLFAASFLRQIGWDVDIYERSPVELVGRGAGILASHPELLDVLEKCGADTRNLGIRVNKRITIDRDGRVIAEKFLPQIFTSWDRLRGLLHETIDPARYHLGYTFARVEQDDGVRVHFADGHAEYADLLIGCDGSRSAVRGEIASSVHPIYTGYFIWRGVCNEAALSSRTRDCIFPYVTFFLPERQQILGYPISGGNDDIRPGHRRFNFIWYRAADAKKLAEMCVDEEGHQHEFSVPPALTRKDLIREVRADGREMLPPPFLDCLHNIEQPFFTPIYDFSMPRIVFGRVALVGDAASTPRPHVGFGVAKAGGDALALADAL